MEDWAAVGVSLAMIAGGSLSLIVESEVPSSTVRPPPPVGEGWGGGKVAAASVDALSSTVKPPPPVGEGRGGGREGFTACGGALSVSECKPALVVGACSLPPPRPSSVVDAVSADIKEAALLCLLPPPQPSPAALRCEGGGSSVGDGVAVGGSLAVVADDVSTSAEEIRTIPPPQPSPATLRCKGGGRTAGDWAVVAISPAFSFCAASSSSRYCTNASSKFGA